MENTTNYNLKKPATLDYYNIQDFNDNIDLLDAALTPEADPDQSPTGNVGKIGQWVSWLTNRIKAITGAANWYDNPKISLAEAANLISTMSGNLSSHTSNTFNPHSVTKAQVGLGNVTNESKATMFTSPAFTGNTPTTNGNMIYHVGNITISTSAPSSALAEGAQHQVY